MIKEPNPDVVAAIQEVVAVASRVDAVSVTREAAALALKADVVSRITGVAASATMEDAASVTTPAVVLVITPAHAVRTVMVIEGSEQGLTTLHSLAVSSNVLWRIGYGVHEFVRRRRSNI
jgi:hypothetical protein